MAFRIPMAESYAILLGRATYNFAYLEWCIFSTAERIHAPFIADAQKQTSGRNATAFRDLVIVSSIPEPLRSTLLGFAARFVEATKRRDALLHGHPLTAANGEQRLAYRGRHPDEEWTEARIAEAALEFEALAIDVNNTFHSELVAQTSTHPENS
jgi:hypothetical protein